MLISTLLFAVGLVIFCTAFGTLTTPAMGWLVLGVTLCFCAAIRVSGGS